MRNLRVAALAALFAAGALCSASRPAVSDPAAAIASPVAPASPALPSWCIGPFVKQLDVNPVITPNSASKFLDPMTGKQVAWEQDNTFNPAAIARDGNVCVLYRAEDDSGEGIGHHTSRVGLAVSKDGLHFKRRSAPVLYPANDSQKQYEWPGGCEDPRCVESPDGSYVLTYTEWNRQTPRLAVATSRDLIHWEKHGPAFADAFGGRFLDMKCKSGAILTKLVGDRVIAAKINGLYWMYWGEGSLHLASSTDLVKWTPMLNPHGDLLVLLATRNGKFDSALVEGGPPALLTDHGIVVLYNGKNANSDGDPAIKPGAYSGGEALFDSKDPAQLLARTDSYFITPTAPYEATGQYAAGTVFIEGLVHFHHKWLLYYGTADSKVAVAEAKG